MTGGIRNAYPARRRICVFSPEQGKDGVVMRGHNPLQKIVGGVMLGLGLLILFARVLPDGFWWFCVGAGLTVGGFLLLTRH